MIIATAGHIDHGKTLLIQALTGVDTDRLPEEKQREMTIDIGFAYLPLAADRSIAFIDVPGHERFIRNMLCGVAAIDFVLFVVAADDGIMPQTREHLAILDLLAVERGAIALTKIDRVDDARVSQVATDLKNLLAPTTLAGAPVYPVSAATGSGIETLQKHIVEVGDAWQQPPPHGAFRLAVDRCFHVVGAGVVATGTAVAGTASVGSELVLQSSDLTLRLRSMHANNRPAKSCSSGQRCALNVAGHSVNKQAIKRGDWIVAQSGANPVRRIDTRFRVLASEHRPFSHWTPVHVHLGAAEATGRVALLEGKELTPNSDGLAQLYLDHPIGACYGDRFIVRDQSAQRTIGGGTVIDIHPPARGRAKPDRLAALMAMDQTDHSAALRALLKISASGVDLARFQRTRNLTDTESKGTYAKTQHRIVEGRGGALAFSLDHWQRLRGAALANLEVWHEKSPASPGLPEGQLLTGSGVRGPTRISVAIARELAAENAIAKDGTVVRLPRHAGAPESPDAALWQRINAILAASGRVPPTVHELAQSLDSDVGKLEKLLVRSARRQQIVRVTANRFFKTTTLRDLATVAEQLVADCKNGRFDVKAFRDGAGIGRNLAIEILEYFDKVKFTRRIQDGREILRPLADVFGSDKDGAQDAVVEGRESHPGGAPGLQIR